MNFSENFRILHHICPKKIFFAEIWGEGHVPYFYAETIYANG